LIIKTFRLKAGLQTGGRKMSQHWFWWLLTMACIVWYLTITVYVAIKGAADIKNMLARLSANSREDE
jgi:hypothetical protein